MKKIIKKSIVIFTTLVFILALTACGENKQNSTTKDITKKTVMNIAALKGPTGMGMVQLMENQDEKKSALDYKFTLSDSPDELVGKIVNGEIDVAAVPTNLALSLYNKTKGKVQFAAVNTLGILYVLENGSSIKSVSDLKGKTIGASGKGTTADYVLQNILKKNNLTIGKDINVEYKTQHADLATALAAGNTNVAVLPQPFVTTAMMKNKNLRIALDLTKEWNKSMGSDSKLAMGCIIVQKKYIEKNKKDFNKFLDEYKKSVDFVNNNVDKASTLIEKYKIVPKAQVAKKAIPYSNIVYIDSKEAKTFMNQFYKVLFAFNPKSVGGKLPDEGFYYER
ncbi:MULTISPECIES: ABC transporter substrate-binding protein [Clostridium]|uniref:ABC transporter substrate-binding protein n=1 Tax=Clostridium TaxID=1485 RepID=UPI00069D60FD|nr:MULTISPECIES: ABC transporter substrate-binding protein [Clostridium]KOF56042.1 lipoprotein [Clostridium sp. DMHC 10]MCD2345523.1 ABC transporter substrate-binding protein [Clostridium guangxiense]